MTTLATSNTLRTPLKRSLLPSIGLFLCLSLGAIAFGIACTGDSEPKFISKPSECYKMENMIRDGNENGLSHSDIQGHLRRIFGGQDEVDRVEKLCIDYYKRRFNN